MDNIFPRIKIELRIKIDKLTDLKKIYLCDVPFL